MKPTRIKRAYYLDITYPEGSHDEEGLPTAGWKPPPCTDPDMGLMASYYDQQHIDHYVRDGRFRWPMPRTYLTYAGADNKARIFRAYGCRVDIQESDPITWGDNPKPQPRPRKYRNPAQTIELLFEILEATRD